MKDITEKTYDQVLTEANDYFLAQGVSIIGKGYEEIATNPALFESYVDQLTEGCSADDSAEMAQIMDNTNKGILHESSMTGIEPVASLSMPVIRKLWPKFALKDAIKNEVSKTPRFVVSYTKPYMQKGDSEKIYLPRGITGDLNKDGKLDDELSDGIKKNYTIVHAVTLASGAAAVVDFTVGLNSASDPAVVIADTPSAMKKQPLDELVFDGVFYPASAIVAGGLYYKIVAATATVAAHAVLQTVIASGTPADGQVVVGGAVADVFEKAKIGKRLNATNTGVFTVGDGQLFVQFAGKDDKATFAAIGTAVTVLVKAGVSSEYNEDSYSVGFDILRQDIDIPTGEHLNAPLPIEALNDMMALYQIDGTKETVDLMTNVFSQKLDLEILDFLRDSLANRPSNEAFQGYGEASEFCLSFDCKPAAGFAGSPKAWREEIKPLIDHLAQKVKNETYLQAGTFTLVGNPLDVQILANVDWSFRAGAGGNVDGVAVDYSVGTYVGANTYKVISSTNVPQGALYIIFTPSSDTQMTYKYYPYTFSVERGYVDPNRSRTPSIMMTKRHTMHEFMPAIGAIVIDNNDGNWFNTYVSTKAIA